jgi:hypothetical protein
MKAKGILPDSPFTLARLARLLVPHQRLFGATVAQPQPVDWAVGWSDQGGEESCTGHGNAKMIFGTALAQGYAGARPDPHSIYALRAADYPALPFSSPLPDEGASMATIVEGLAHFGCLAAGDGPPTAGDRLDLAQLEAAQGFRVPLVSRIDLAGEVLVEACIAALARGCLSFAMMVDEGYERLTNGQVWSGPSGKILGGHCQAVDAWRQGTNGVEFKVAGSWGPQFGCIWMPAAIFGQVASDVYVGQVVPKLTITGVS